MSDRFDELSQRVLEGEATPGERERLATLVARDSGLRGRHEELERAFGLLAEARPEEPPAGIPEAVLREIAARERAGRPGSVAARRRLRPTLGPGWLRLVLPAAAALVAVALLWSVRGRSPWGDSAEQVTGTMTRVSPAAILRLGDGARRTTVRAEATSDGFLLRIVTGSEPVQVSLRSEDPGVRLAGSRAALAGGGPAWQRELPEYSSGIVHGVALGAAISVQVQVRFRDGRASSGVLRISPRPLAPNGRRPGPASGAPDSH